MLTYCKTRNNCEKYTFCNIKSLKHIKNVKKWPPPLFRPKTNHTCHKKPNPTRETVPLKRGRVSHQEFCYCPSFSSWPASFSSLSSSARGPRRKSSRSSNGYEHLTAQNYHTKLKDDILKGLSNKIDFKNGDENGQILALISAAAGFLNFSEAPLIFSWNNTSSFR